MIPTEIGSYLTILDLGPWGAVYTEGWDRRAAVSGAVTRQMINYERIYLPRSGDPVEIFAAAMPRVQTSPWRLC